MAEEVVLCLQEMKRIYSSPKFWIKGSLAADKNEVPCAPQAKKACGWCMLGAVAATGMDRIVKEKTIRRLAREIKKSFRYNAIDPLGNRSDPRETIMTFNDGCYRKFKDVIKVIDGAIQNELVIKDEEK